MVGPTMYCLRLLGLKPGDSLQQLLMVPDGQKKKRAQMEGANQGCIRREGASEAAPEAVRRAVGGGCQSGWGRLLSVAGLAQGLLG